ncbi:MAG TPA: helix-turn-helix domain-containing protein [Allosphingosinicella sp.]|nr:helix-turn-helix domain-containing protein [Allosphingosinicella sp.]
MSRLVQIDAIFRLLAVGQLLLIALVVARGGAPIRLRTLTILLLMGIASYLVAASSDGALNHGPLWLLVELGAQSAPLFLWLFAHTIFERRLPSGMTLMAIAVTLGCWLILASPTRNGWSSGAATIQQLLAFILSCHAIFIGVRDWSDDLSERRRRFRAGFVLIVGIEAIAVIATNLITGLNQTSPDIILLVQSGTTLLAVFAFGSTLLSSDTELRTEPSVEPAPRSALSPAEHVLKQELEDALAGGVYQTAGLSIGSLAARLKVPEHRLRALINQRLGYRNFSAFLNTYRVADAKERLADRGRVDLPVLTIAMDLGYGSLAPFNRAFREATGQTPTEFRRMAIIPSEEI